MGLLHCPVGAAYPDDEPCIDCGLCSATSKEEMLEASKRVSHYLKSHAKGRGAIKKIAICDKKDTGCVNGKCPAGSEENCSDAIM